MKWVDRTVIFMLIVVTLMFGLAIARLDVVGAKLKDAEVTLRILKDKVPDLMTSVGTCEATLNQQEIEHTDELNEVDDSTLECQVKLGSQAMELYVMKQVVVGLSNDLDQCNNNLWRSL